jgi:methylthioribose-1-phosphate isomerase
MSAVGSPGELPRAIELAYDAATGRASASVLDQRRLPGRVEFLQCHTLDEVADAVSSLAVRGAPALGLAAACALALWACNESRQNEAEDFLAGLAEAAGRIAVVRPTAVNLGSGAAAAVEFARQMAISRDLADVKAGMVGFARRYAQLDEEGNRRIGHAGADLLMGMQEGGLRLLTLCNAGSLATAYFGTALGVAYALHGRGRLDKVWACETRPVLQGSRLTLWELMRSGVPCTLISDSMAATTMAQGLVDAVVVGADRVCANGDVANKVGTLMLSVLARHFGVPFIVCAPSSTIDASMPDASGMVIEQRDTGELTGFHAHGRACMPEDAPPGSLEAALAAIVRSGTARLNMEDGQYIDFARLGPGLAVDAWFATAPHGAKACNPAFDVTPAALITHIVTEKAVNTPPYCFSG